jgi:glycosyltransferase involved in cell wall biosynthesis
VKIVVLTSLYPSPPRPREGIFAQRRWDGMAQRGHEVSVVQPVPHAPRPFATGTRSDFRAMPTFETRGELEVYRPRYVHLPRWPKGNAERFASTGVRALKRYGTPDVVVCDYAWPAGVAAPLLARLGVPCVINGRGSDVLQVAGEAGLGVELAAALRSAGHWTGVSQDLVDTLDALAQRPGHGVLVPNGVDDQLFSPGERAAARAALGQSPTLPIVLVVGHLIARKDPLLALEAFRRGAPNDARLVFVGTGPLDHALRGAVLASGLERRVAFVGEVDAPRLVEWYRAANALLLTSRREGRPNVVLEALSCGLPVVATAAGGTAELLGGVEGALVDSRDPGVVGARLAATLAAPPPVERLRAVVRPLTWDACLERLEVVLAGCVK